MGKKPYLGLLVAFLSAGLMLFAGWTLLPEPVAAARSVTDTRSVQSVRVNSDLPQITALPVLDPRWLAMIRSLSTSQGASLPDTGFSMGLNLTSGYLAGLAPQATLVEYTLFRDGARLYYATALPIPEPTGNFFFSQLYWSYICNEDFCDYLQPQNGDSIQVVQGSASISLTVHTLTALADAPLDRVTGQGSPGSQLTLHLFPVEGGATLTMTVPVDAEGSYRADWSGSRDLHPADSGYAAYSPAPDTQIYTYFVTPFLRVQSGGGEIGGLAAPHSDGMIHVSYPGYPDFDGFCYSDDGGRLHCESWYYLPLENPFPGTAAEGTVRAEIGGQVFTAAIQAIGAKVNVAEGTISGLAPAGLVVEVLANDGPLPIPFNDNLWIEPADHITTVTSSGLFSAALPLGIYSYGAAVVTGIDGHQTFARFAAPYFDLHLGYLFHMHDQQGQIDDQNYLVTTSVRGPSGFLKGSLPVYAASNGYLLDYEPRTSPMAIRIDSGDRITVETRSGIQAAFDIPALTADADPLSAIVRGSAPPDTLVEVRLDDYRILDGGPDYELVELRLVVTSTAEGAYQADFTALGGFSDWARGQVRSTTLEGYTIRRDVRAQPNCAIEPIQVWVGGNHVSAENPGLCGGLTLRLYDSSGRLKYEQKWNAYYYSPDIYLYNADGAPVGIYPGDRLELTNENYAKTTVIPSLTAELDAEGETLAGLAPPGETVFIYPQQHFPPWPPYDITATASTSGAYSLTFPASIHLRPGDGLEVTVRQSGFSFITLRHWTALSLNRGNGCFTFSVASLTPYTFTYQAPGSQAEIHPGIAAGEWPEQRCFREIPNGATAQLEYGNNNHHLYVPELTAILNPDLAQISGQAPSGAGLLAALWVDGGFLRIGTPLITETIASASGAYTAVFPSAAPTGPALGILSYFDDTGDQVHLPFASPHWELDLFSQTIFGYGLWHGAPLTLTVKANDASYSQTIHTTISFYNNQFVVGLDHRLLPGDQMRFEYPGLVFTDTLPSLSAEHDFLLGAVVGQAPPEGRLSLRYDLESYPYLPLSRDVLVSPDGSFGVDTSDLGLGLGDPLQLVYEDPLGNITRLNFAVSGIRVYLPRIGQTQ